MRENLSLLASKNLDPASQTEKQKLQIYHEKQTSQLNKGFMEDKMRRIKMNNVIKDNIQKEHLDQYVKKDKLEVNNYYRNYVE